MKLFVSFSLLIFVVIFLGCGEAPSDPPGSGESPLPAGALEAAETIDETALKPHILALADDSMRGRGPSSDGDRMARAYLAEQLAALGYAPGADDGGWEQPFDIVGITSSEPPQWTFEAGGTKASFDHWDEYVATSGVQAPSSEISNAEVVFVGYGIQAPEYGWDDFKGRDLSGKVLLMLNSDPDWDPSLFEGEKRLYYGRWTYKYESAARQGAVGAIIIHTDASAGYPFQVVQGGWTGEQFELPAHNEPRTQVTGWLTEAAATELFALAGQDLAALTENARSSEFEPVPLGITTSITLNNTIERVSTANVLGVLEGSDPNLADEVVVYTAHHDHMGVGKPNAAGDDIYITERATMPPVAPRSWPLQRRSQSCLSSPAARRLSCSLGPKNRDCWAQSIMHGILPLRRAAFAANINFDSANIWGRTHNLTLIGLGKSTLDEVAVSVATLQGRVIEPDHFADRGYYYRSDQFSFAKIGVPALYFHTGTSFIGRPEGWGEEQINTYTSVHYHQPSDELNETWNFDGMIEDAQLGFLAGSIIANQDELPGWMPGDEFEAARKNAVAAAQEQ